MNTEFFTFAHQRRSANTFRCETFYYSKPTMRCTRYSCTIYLVYSYRQKANYSFCFAMKSKVNATHSRLSTAQMRQLILSLPLWWTKSNGFMRSLIIMHRNYNQFKIRRKIEKILCFLLCISSFGGPLCGFSGNEVYSKRKSLSFLFGIRLAFNYAFRTITFLQRSL